MRLTVFVCFCVVSCTFAEENKLKIQDGVIKAERSDPCGVVFPCARIPVKPPAATKTQEIVAPKKHEGQQQKLHDPKPPTPKSVYHRRGQPEFEQFWSHPVVGSSPMSAKTAASIVESLVVKSPSPSLEKRISLTAGKEGGDFRHTVFITATVLCSGAAVFGMVAAGMHLHKLRQRNKSAADAEYPQYGITGPAKPLPRLSGDEKLASGAHLQHYQHTKKQILVMAKPNHLQTREPDVDDSDDSDVEGIDADFNVYECPGLASAGDIEVNNPLFGIDGIAPGARGQH